ncbi:hypothetical protein AWH62_10335 [Maricaulis sp. W15]|uniref:hypothetical protein n=1 Tax=Maricaulis sp. W15 TaxID=1772333 RepID=UPI0009490957|nr:hypothetical protein [Maricaulis sp. W15]OLF72233.1 hypothetical protein AWH62_10335 [Maricaulis sp. W15]
MTMTHRPPLSIAGTLRNAFAWLIAALLSGLAIIIAFGLFSALESGRFEPAESGFLEALIPGSLFIGTYVAVLTALPTVILTWVRRAAGWYGLVSHLLMGALTGAATIQIFGFPLSYGVEGLPMTGFFAATGLVGGAVYWRLSVRP